VCDEAGEAQAVGQTIKIKLKENLKSLKIMSATLTAIPTMKRGLLNCTPHNITIDTGKVFFALEAPKDENGEPTHVIRCTSAPQSVLHDLSAKYDTVVSTPQQFNGMYVPSPLLDKVSNADFDLKLPDGCSGIVVSMPVGQYLRHEHDKGTFLPSFDVIGPDTSPAHVLRDANGQIYGTDRLVAYVAGRERAQNRFQLPDNFVYEEN
jgi:hypothetical protein